MLPQSRAEAIDRLRKAYHEEYLTLYLGAGVSRGNNLPTWDELVAAMFFSATRKLSIDPMPNYIRAIAEWHLPRRGEPLDITARKIRRVYKRWFGDESDQKFLENLYYNLYTPFLDPSNRRVYWPEIDKLLEENTTLASIVKLCIDRKVRSIITYNYDNLLEIALKEFHVNFQSIYSRQQTVASRTLPIYHVHGYIPLEGPMRGSSVEEIIFTEEQYHLASHYAYSWANIAQIHCMSSTFGLMIGLSLTDRNVRRLLDAISLTPIKAEGCILLSKQRLKEPNLEEIQKINQKAASYENMYHRGGIKPEATSSEEIREIIRQVEEQDIIEQEDILKDLGLYPIWYEDHREIPGIINEILSR